MKVVLGRPFHDSTSGLYAANAKAMPVLARPYTSGAPEVEAVIRLHDEGLRVEEVAVDMRERASGESKLQGKKAVVLVATVIGTLVTAGYLRHRRTRAVAERPGPAAAGGSSRFSATPAGAPRTCIPCARAASCEPRSSPAVRAP